MSKICTNCNSKNPDEAKFCRKCGKQDFVITKLINDTPTDKFENKTELDMFFSNDFTEKEKEEFRQKNELKQMEKRVKEIDEALKGRRMYDDGYDDYPVQNKDINEAPDQNVELENEDAIYEQVMLEIEEDKKVKATWARALAQSDGDKDKAEALYIQFRVKEIIKLENKITLYKTNLENGKLLKSMKDILNKDGYNQY